jgi:hypothetical protein
MKSNPIPSGDNQMSNERVYYFDLIEIIERYIDQVGITKASADILTMLSNRLYRKLDVIGPALSSFLDDQEEDIYTKKDGTALKEENEPISPESTHKTSNGGRTVTGG